MSTEGCVLSVVIVSYNTMEMTLDCLRALHEELVFCFGSEWRTQRIAEIRVVDNASQDGTVDAIRELFPHVRLIVNASNVGFGAANNQALRQAEGEFALLLNSDAFACPGALRVMLERLQSLPDAAVVGPRLLNADGTLQPSCYRFPGPGRALCENLLLTACWPDHPLLGDYRAWPHDAEREVEFVIGACMLARRRVLVEVGLFDEDFFLYAEEADLCWRLRRAGWNVVFTPGCSVRHLSGASGRQQSDRVFCEFRRAQERFVRKHYGAGALLVYRLLLVTGACLRIAIFGMAGACRPSRRRAYFQVVEEWRRILVWTVGWRGPGLSELDCRSAAT